MGLLARFLCLLLIAAAIAGCASTSKPSEEERVSSIPWAKPESWQGQGPFGGLLQQGQGR